MASKIAEAYVDISVKTAAYKKQLSGLETATKKTTQSIQQRFQTLGPTFKKVGRGMAIAGTAITAAMGAAVYASMNLEKQLANVSTMLDSKAMPIMDEYKDSIKEMAMEFGESTETLTKGLYDILSASIAPTKALDVLAVSSKAATAGLTDTGVAADAITTIINSYGYAAEDAGAISDILFAIVKKGKTTFAELAPSIGKVAATAAISGVSLEELGATLATVTRAGIRTQEATTAVNGILRAFLKPTDDAAKAAKEFGFELNTNTLRTIGLRGVLKLLTTATAEQTAEMFPNIRGLKGIAAAVQDVEGYTGDYALMLNSAGLAQEAFEKQTNTLAFSFNQMKQSVVILGTEIGDVLLPILKDTIDKIRPLISKILDWAKAHPKLSSVMVKFLAILGPVLIALGSLLMILPSLIALYGLKSAALIKLGAAFHFMLGPIGLIIIAIAAAVAAFLYFYKTSDKFRNFINKIVAYIKAFVQNAWNRLIWLKDNWGKLWKTIFEGLPKIAKNAFDNLITIFKWVWDFIKGWGSWLGKNFINVWKNMFSAITTAVKNFGDNIWKQLQWIGEKMKPKNWFKEIERPDWTPLLEGFEAVWEEMPKIAELQLKKIADGVNIYFEPLPELVKPVFNAIKEGAEGAGKAIDVLTTATEKYITTFDKLQKIRKKEDNEEEKRRKAIIEANAERRKLLERIAQIEKEIADKVAKAVEAAERIKREAIIETNAERRKILERIAQIEKEIADKVAKAAKVAEELKRKELIKTNKERRSLLTRIAQIEKEITDKVAKAAKAAEDIKRKEVIKTNKERRKILERIAQIEKEIADKVAKAVKVAEELKRKEIIKTNKERRSLLTRIAQIEKEIADKVVAGAVAAERIKRNERIETNAERRKLLERVAQIEKDIEDKVAAGVTAAERIKRNERIETNAQRRKLLERIAQIEKATADKVVKINWDEMREMYKNWEEFFDSVEELSFDNVADFALYWSSLTDEQKEALKEQYDNWEDFTEKVKSTWKDAFESIASALSTFSVTVLTTTTSAGEAFQDLGRAIYIQLVSLALNQLTTVLTTQIVSAFAIATAAGVAFASVMAASIVGVIAFIISLIFGLGRTSKAAEEAISKIEQMAESVKEAVYYSEEAVRESFEKIQAIIDTTEHSISKFMGAFDIFVISTFTEAFIVEMEKMGLAISESLEEAQRDLEGFEQARLDLQSDTRGKLIAELDKYYDYQKLKMMSLEELLALSAETRVGIETGAIEEVEDTEEEKAARDKDRATSRLQQIEEQYAKEDEMFRRKIELTKIEIKFIEYKIAAQENASSARTKQLKEELGQMLENYYASVDAYDGITEATEDATEAVENYGKEGKTAAEKVQRGLGEVIGALKEVEDETDTARIGMEHWREEGLEGTDKLVFGFKRVERASEELRADIDRIPTLVDFNIIGHLHMPEIPNIPDQEFKISGGLDMPNIPSYQGGIPYIPRTHIGVLHPKEAVLTAPQAEDWRAGRGGVAGNTFNTRILNTGDLRSDVDMEQFIRKVADRIAETVRRV